MERRWIEDGSFLRLSPLDVCAQQSGYEKNGFDARVSSRPGRVGPGRIL